MDSLIYTAASGAKHILEKQATTSNNLANVSTTGFRAQMDMFRAAPVQGPGLPGLRDRRRYPAYKAYVQGVIGAFANDDRILGWDVWNEPDNGADQYKGQEGKFDKFNPFLKSFHKIDPFSNHFTI